MRERIIWGLAAVAAVALVLSGAQGAGIAARAATFALAIGSVVVLTGWSGQLNLHVAAIGLGWGAYASVALATNGVPSLLAIALAPVVVAPAALIVGAVAVRFRGLELAIATLAAGLAFEQMAFQNLGKWLGRSGEGTQFQSSVVEIARPGGFEGERAYAVLALVLAALVLALVARIGAGRAGRILRAIRDREVVAEARGIGVYGWRVAAFVLSIAVAAAGGAIAAGQTGAVTPESFRLTLSLQFLAVAVLAGVRSLRAAAVGAALLVLAQEAAGLPVLNLIAGDRIDLVFGAGLIAALWWRTRRAPGLAVDAGAHAVADALPEPTPVARDTILRAEDIAVSFGEVPVLGGVSFTVARGEVVGLVGGNGAGKTTLFDVISGLVTPDEGRVFLDGQDVTEMAPHRRAHFGLARTFQAIEVFEGLRVIDGVRAVSRSGDEVAARAALAEVGIDHLADADPTTLPFATLRLVEIAGALVADPSVILLDEPLAGLDAAERTIVLHAVAAMRARGRAVVIIEHDHEAVASIADRTYVLAAGRIEQEVRVAARA